MRSKTINLRSRLLPLTPPAVMGILNLTPDSFYAGSRTGLGDVVARAGQMLAEGAALLDLGAMSTRPGAEEISIEEEEARLLLAVKAVLEAFPEAIISIDTYRPEVARKAMDLGAAMVNDVSGGSDAMYALCARYRAPYVLMHTRGTPQTMTGLTDYQNLTVEVANFLARGLQAARASGCRDVVLDPGFGFAKTPAQNLELLNRLEYLHTLDAPILVGLSRKTTVWKTLGITPDEAGNGSTVLHTIALIKGASIIRTHDVREAVEAVKLIQEMQKAGMVIPGFHN